MAPLWDLVPMGWFWLGFGFLGQARDESQQFAHDTEACQFPVDGIAGVLHLIPILLLYSQSEMVSTPKSLPQGSDEMYSRKNCYRNDRKQIYQRVPSVVG